MKKRVISTVIGIIVLALVMVCQNIYVFNVALTVVCLIGIGELYHAFRTKGYHPITWVGFLVCFGVFFVNLQLFSQDTIKRMLIESLPFLFCIAFAWMIFSKGKHAVPDVMITLFGIIYIPFLLVFLSLTRQLSQGHYLVWFIFVSSMELLYFIAYKFTNNYVCLCK